MASKSKKFIDTSRESSYKTRKELNSKIKFDESSSSDEEYYNNPNKIKKSNQHLNNDDDISEQLSEESQYEEENEESEEKQNEFSNEDDDDDDNEDDDVEKKSDIANSKKSKFDDMKNVIKEQLTGMSFEEVMKLQNKLGLKKFKEVMSQENVESKNKNFTRLNKNRPQEISSKKPVPVFRNVFQVKKREIIDPRFSSAFGEYKPDMFRKSYSFLNDMRMREKEMLVQQLKEEEDPVKKAQVKSALLRLKHQIKSFEDSEKKEKLTQEFKRRALEDAKEGKKPHYVNKSEQKILELAEKYKELKKSGKIENYLAKKRKKQLSKDSKHLTRTEHIRFV